MRRTVWGRATVFYVRLSGTKGHTDIREKLYRENIRAGRVRESETRRIRAL